VRGDRVEVQQLEEAELQRSADRRVQAAALRQRVGDVVERAGALDGAVRELAGEGALAGVEAGGLGMQRLVGVGLLLEDPAHDAEGGSAGGRRGHLPRIGTVAAGYLQRAMREWWMDDQALAYAIVEQGRVACERLGEHEHRPAVARRLWAAHNGFGLAGYAVSDHLLEGVRPALHLMIEEAGPATLDGLAGAEHALGFAIHGAAAIERCFATPWLTAQMQVAHRAVRQAHVALTGLVGLGTAAQRTIDATRAGHLERAWQARWLRVPSLDELRHDRGARPVAA
jgi:hypothetical protein